MTRETVGGANQSWSLLDDVEGVRASMCHRKVFRRMMIRHISLYGCGEARRIVCRTDALVLFEITWLLYLLWWGFTVGGICLRLSVRQVYYKYALGLFFFVRPTHVCVISTQHTCMLLSLAYTITLTTGTFKLRSTI